MLLRFFFFLPFLVLILADLGCAGHKVSKAKNDSLMIGTIRMKSADLAVSLIRILAEGNKDTLIEDSGWLEYVIEIENLAAKDLTVQNVKLLSQKGRYVDSATAYEQITSPPEVGAELAGEVAENAAGIAAEQFIPFGGTIFGVFSNAASASSAAAKADAKRNFMMRVLKNVELAPAGKMEGSAFLPNITRPKSLVVFYVQNNMANRVEIPLSIQGK
jgi:hypothetical protein